MRGSSATSCSTISPLPPVRRLLPLLEAHGDGASSSSPTPASTRHLDFGDLQHRRGKPGLNVSGRTQFANDLLAVELHTRFGGRGIAATCVFPNFVRTRVFDNARGLPPVFHLLRPIIHLRSITPEAAAHTPAHRAHAPEAATAGSRFYGPALAERPIPARVRKDRAAGLWSLREDLVRHHLP